MDRNASTKPSTMAGSSQGRQGSTQDARDKNDGTVNSSFYTGAGKNDDGPAAKGIISAGDETITIHVCDEMKKI